MKVCFLVCAEDTDKNKKKQTRKLIEHAVKAFFQLSQAYWILWMKPPQFFFLFSLVSVPAAGLACGMSWMDAEKKGAILNFSFSLSFLFTKPCVTLCLSFTSYMSSMGSKNEWDYYTLKIKYNSVDKDTNCHYKSVLPCLDYILSKT